MPWNSRRVRLLLALLMSLSAGRVDAAAVRLDFGRMPVGELPEGFQTALTGGGGPPAWRIEQVDAPSALPSLTPGGEERTRETVLAQVSEDPTDERFPLLVYQPLEVADFTARLEFRTMRGRVEQMAGLAFRYQDETNYYVIRASSRGNNFRFYKFVNGARSTPIGPEVRIPRGEWHTLEVTCKGNTILCRLDGREAIPMLTDTSFTRGRLALWTKSDSVSHFRSLQVEYDLVKALPERLVERGMDRFPRLRSLTVYTREAGRVAAVAATDVKEVGMAGGVEEREALESGRIFAGRQGKDSVSVFPLRDRNGDPLFAVRLRMRPFAGQTDGNIAARGRIIADYLEGLVQAADASGEAGR